ncbi:MAG: oxidoreductase [Caulobacterales bacterium 32-69-10]|nr:MAG: oxidoreductase [Caulobacterales bacterium 32-69-10]
MHLDLQQADADTARDADICVIGSGAAGLTAARRLLALGRSVTLLESGGLDHEPAVAALGAGENLGEPYYPLDHARLRFFGGTTAIWGGRIARLDPIDFEVRDWVPNSGWPFGAETLEPWYEQARAVFDLPPVATGPDDLRRAAALPDFDPARLQLGLWEFDGKFNRFTFDACGDLAAHPRCTVVTHATVTQIALAAGGGGVERVIARSLSGRTLTLRPREVVLAAGGIENPRLLLASGIGGDQVGRYFMEHPHGRGGRIVGGAAWSLLRAFARSHRVGREKVAAMIALSADRQAELRVLNSSLTIAARQPVGTRQFWGMRAYEGVKHRMAPTRRGRGLWMTTKRLATFAQRHVDPLRPWLLHRAGLLDLALVLRAEQAPNPDSRVLLSRETDALGVPRAALDWRTTPLDVESAAGLVSTLAAEAQRLGLGRVEPAPWLACPEDGWRTDPLISVHPIGGYHHMGTTRMSDDPKRGVADAFGRVHGVENLHIVGSSVFPTSGWANPTLTIVALALRTAERVAGR